MRTRAEHLDFCKQRAHEYLARHDLGNAVTSMLSDMEQHPETKRRNSALLAQIGMRAIMSRDPEEVRRFIDGFR